MLYQVRSAVASTGPHETCHCRGVPLTPSTAFVLGGGGMLGAAEVGMLRALIEQAILPDLIVGSSVGALNGALIAADPTLAGVQKLEHTWTALSDRGVFGGSILGQISTLARHGTHLHSNQGLRELIDHGIGMDVQFADLSARFECIAACIERAAPRWFTSGPVTPAVLASCAVPGLLPPVHINGEHFYDGGLIRSVPIGRAVELGASRIFVLHVGRLEQPLEVPTRPWQVAVAAFEITRRHHFEEEMAALPAGVEVHVLPSGSSVPTVTVRYRTTSGVSDRIGAAYAATSMYLQGITK
jgi:NTE family protein